LCVRRAAPATLIFIEIWGDQAEVERRLAAPLPDPCRSATVDDNRLIWWAPSTWLVRTVIENRDRALRRLIEALGDDGAAIEATGGLVRILIEGTRWRELMMIGGYFDAESPTFGLGSVAGTLIHHTAVHLDVLSDNAVEAYVAPSYAEHLLSPWSLAVARLGDAEP
jgi:heterotetrameric sarcosine oxidase gamma subunit